MKKLFMLGFANIRKTKGNTISLLIMFFIAALLINAGLLVFVNFGSYFDKISTQLKTSNVYYALSSDSYTVEVENYLESNDNINNMETINAYWSTANSIYNNVNSKFIYLFLNADQTCNLSRWKFIGDHLTPDSQTIYLPYNYELNGYALNDPFSLSIDNQTFTFTIKGFVEDVYFSSQNTGLTGIYLPQDVYDSLTSKLDSHYRATVIFANLKHIDASVVTGLKNITKADDLITSYLTMNEGHVMFSIDLLNVKMARTLMATMVALIIVAFSAIIVGVCLLVIRFRIGNSIEEDMSLIGSLKAIGYKSKQIIASIILQFLMIALVGSILGIGISYIITPVLSGIFAQQSGLMWVQGFDPVISGISLGVILAIVILAAYFTARRIKKIQPIVALRGGMVTHSFKKNHFPLVSSKGNLTFTLALKSITHNLKQSIMMIIILAAVSVAATFSVVMFYNTAINNQAFLEVPGMELSNVSVSIKPDEDNLAMLNSIKGMSNVSKAQYLDQVTVKVNEEQIVAFVMDDYSQKETDTVYEGRYPLHNNEVAISGTLAPMYNKKIGDTITVSLGETESEFLITGFTQGAFMNGKTIFLRTDGILLLNPTFKQQDLQIYLTKGTSTETFISQFEAQYSNHVLLVTNVDKDIATGAGTYVTIVEQVGVVMSITTILIVLLVLYFVINSQVIRQKRELGIQKAVGFTTKQLMNQLSLSLLFPIIIGVGIGSLIGIIATNPLMSIVQRGMGVMKASYIITPLWIILFGLVIALISYLFSLLLTSRIRNISAYTLVVE